MKNFFSSIRRGWTLHFFVASASFLILYSRRPDAVDNPQFWAEDGGWYADAYNRTFFEALFLPQSGYFQTLSRLVAELTQLFPLAYASLIFNAVSLAVQIMIVNFLISKRFSKTVPNLGICLLLGFLSLAVPHSSEPHANLTNSQWHLAILGFLVIVSFPGDKLSWRIFDIIVVTIAALTGPFCIFLLPVAAIMYWQRRENQTLVLTVILSVSSIIQGICVFATRQPSVSKTLENPLDLINIICGQIFFSGIFSERKFLKLTNSDWRYAALILIGIMALAIIIYSLVKAQLELKLFIVFASATLMLTVIYSEWQPLAYPLYGQRYWLIPITCYLSTIVYAGWSSKNLIIKSLGIFLMMLLPIGIYNDWRYKPYTDFQFQEFVREFEESPGGTEVKTKINPDWDFSLKKK